MLKARMRSYFEPVIRGHGSWGTQFHGDGKVVWAGSNGLVGDAIGLSSEG